jgi:hypothetical protein
MVCVLDENGRNPFPEKVRALAALIERGDTPEIGGIDGFDWAHLHALGLARKSRLSDRYGDTESISYCYTGPSYVLVEDRLVSANPIVWFDEGGRVTP